MNVTLKLSSLEKVSSFKFDLPQQDKLINNQFVARLSGSPCAPVLAVMGGISAGRAVSDTSNETGWWGDIAAPDKAIDTNSFQILSFDYVDTSDAQPANGKPWPQINTSTQAKALADAMTAFGIDKLAGIVGASYGGMVALKFAELYPEKLDHLTILCAAHKPNPLAQAWRIVQRNILEFALKHGDPEGGIALARQLAMVTYRSAEELGERFGANGGQCLQGYLKARGEAYKTTTSLARYGALSQSIDQHSVDPANITTPCSLISFTGDQIVPPADMEELHRLLPNSKLTTVDTRYGHDGFLKETKQLNEIISNILLKKTEA